jgi:hypothetical protein
VVDTKLPAYNALVSSARILPAKRIYEPKYQSWQDEVWDYYDRLGEFQSGVHWLANTMSRLRLLAAEVTPGGDEPRPIETGPAADAMTRLVGGTAGQSSLMHQFSIHLAVPGEGWLVGENSSPRADQVLPSGEETWSVYSADEIRLSPRRSRGGGGYQVKEDENSTSWRDLSPDSLVVRCWVPHPRYGWRADSASMHARTKLLELDLINKRIIATIISRLVANGILLYNKDILSVPQVEGTGDPSAVDPFAQILVDVATQGIEDPTSPAATIPIPIGFSSPGGLADVSIDMIMKHLTFSNDLDKQLLDERDAAISSLATSLDMPSEVMKGTASLNHWGMWQVEESGMKIHVAPTAEVICHSLSTGYLVPMLRAAGAPLTGPSGGRIIVWYDPSEIVHRPDKSANTVAAYDRFEVSGKTLRRETGLDEDDKPKDNELERMALLKMMGMPRIAEAAFQQLFGRMAAPTPDEAVEPRTRPDQTAPGQPERGDDSRELPDTREKTPDEAQAAGTGAPLTLALREKLLEGVVLEDVDTEIIVRLHAAATEALQQRDALPAPNGRAAGWAPAGEVATPRTTPKRRARKRAPRKSTAKDVEPVGG